MADVKWIKMATNMFDNRKIKQIECLPDGDAIIVVWMKMLCLAGNINDCGSVYFTKDIPYTEQMLATQFNRPLATIQLAIKTFEQFGMIEVVDNILMISNWEKYQNVDKLHELREYNRLAQQKSRAKRKLLQNVNDMSMTSQQCQGTDKDIEEDKDKEVEKDKNSICDSIESTPTPEKPAKPVKHKYGEYKHVMLTDAEHDKLTDDFGSDLRDKAIKLLDEYIEEKGYKSKSHNLAIRRWVMDAVREREAKQYNKGNQPYPKQTKADELDQFYAMANEWADS